MHIHFEKTINATCDCTILSMSWMGKVPDELPEDEGWKLNRTHYYQEGWLATGNVRGVLGVTYTTSHWKKNPSEVPNRTNYNLRGHRSQITLVQWNEPYQKLASCDSSGIIFVWIKFEGRWSIELINDRNTPVTHFSWSHDGRMALICYQDNFVLVGSVAGQRYWSTLLNLDATITCGIWTPDDQQVYFGTSNGQVVVMDVHGVMLSQVQLPSDSPISSMAWSCEKFKMEESEDGEATSSSNHYCNKRPFLLAVCFKTGGIYLMKSYDDVAPIYISTGMHGLHMEWSNSGEFLAVAGSRPIEVLHENGNRVKEYSNSLHVYNHQGIRIVNINIPHVLSPVTSMTWGHNDKRIFVATGKLVHVGWVSKRIASLQLLCRLAIYKSLSTETCVSHLPLPLPVRALITSLHTQTVPSLLPNLKDLRDFVIHPPSGNLRLYCTMIRHDEDTNQSPGTAYTLYLEYLGGLIPILKGKRTSKIRPEFVIYDPQAAEERRFGLMIQQTSGTGGSAGGPEKTISGMVVPCGVDGGVGVTTGCGACHCCNHSHHHHVVHFHHHHQNSTQVGNCGGSADMNGCKAIATSCPGASVTNSTCTASTCSIASGSNGSCGSSSTTSSSNNSAANGLAHSNMTHFHCHCCCHHHHHPIPPQPAAIPANNQSCSGSTIGSSAASLGFSDSSESEDVELCASPRMQRKRYRNRQRERERLLEREREREWERTRSSVHLMPEPAHPHQLVYNDVLPEAVRLVEVTSNIWGTKFKIHGVNPALPDSLGQVTYKTSLLHLQPRQMTLLITELRDDIFFSPDSPFIHGSYMDEDEEDLTMVVGGPEPSSSLGHSNSQHHNNGLNSAVIIQNVGGGGGGGGGVRGDVYTGANVIYHPQGVPRGEDSPPIISTSRCYLQSSSSASSSTTGTSHTNQIPSGSSSTLASSLGASGTGSPYHSSSRNPGPSSSSGASASTSCCSSSTHLQYYASSSTTTTTRSTDSALPYDLEDQDEFPYVDLTANTEIIQFRETLRNSLNYEGIQTVGSTATSSSSGVISNCRSSLCQVCEPATMPIPQTPLKMATAISSGMSAEATIDLTDKAMQRIKYGLTRAQIERVGESDGSGVATSTPSPPRTSSRSLRSPKKVSGYGGSTQSRLSTPAHGHQVSSIGEAASSSSFQQNSNSLYHQQQQQLQPIPVTAPMFVRRSMSASYLDNVDRNVVVSLDVVGNEQAGNSPPKRLILVKKRGGQENDQGLFSTANGGKPRLKDWGKSKSWDSCDLSGWKKGVCGSSATLSTSAYRKEVSTSSCPKCRFPSTEPVRACVTMAEPLLHHCRAKVPMTPARRNVMTNCSTSRIPLLAQQQKASSSSVARAEQQNHASSSSGEDVIEIANDASPPNSTPTHAPSPSPTPPPPPVHRRSLSLLTPLLRRREMLNAARQQQSADAASTSTPKRRNNSGSNQGSSSNNHPHSSSFIPPGSPQHQPRSSPTTPATQRKSKQSYLSSASSPFRQLFINSPLLTRRKNKSNNNSSSSNCTTLSRNQRRRSIIDSSDEEGILEENNPLLNSSQHNHPQNQNSSCCTTCNANEGVTCAHNATVPLANHTSYRSDCEGLQRTQIHQKVGRKKIQCIEPCPMTPRRREFLMHNKAPMWNENSQVYQLDFGGRVTQESAKNFQIEFRGKQVMQFGRIDGSAYTLDFQYPFAAVQAFSVALANVTQRLK